MTMTREQVAALLDGTTPGPWDWTINRQFKTVELSGKGGDLTVISFARWGMGSAAPVFWFWKGNVSDEPKRADALAVPAPGRDHHKHWFARIDHPDARLTAAAPDLARQLLAAMDALADADMAQAALVERAAETVRAILAGDADHVRDLHPQVAEDRDEYALELSAAIRRLAPDAGVKDLAALRWERDAAQKLWKEAGRERIAAEADNSRLAAELAEARKQVEALREAAKEARTDLMICADNVRDAAKTNPRWEGTAEVLMARCRQIDAALAAASPALTPAEQSLFDQSMAMREVAGQIAKEQME